MSEVLLYKEYNSRRETKQQLPGPDYTQDAIPYAQYNSNGTEGPAGVETLQP